MGATKDLKKARELLTAHEDGWVKGVFARTVRRNGDGTVVGCYCSGGAIRKAATGTAYVNSLAEDPRTVKALRRFAQATPELRQYVTNVRVDGDARTDAEVYLTAIVRWNDVAWRTKDDVLAAFDAAIEEKK